MTWLEIKKQTRQDRCECGRRIQLTMIEKDYVAVACPACDKRGYVVNEEEVFLVPFGAWWIEWE